RFRILIVGRANAGKTTVLQRVCNTTEQPRIFDASGSEVCHTSVSSIWQQSYHDIRNELIFSSNPGFIFHDSCGFEAGSEEEFEKTMKFILERANTTKLEERIHAIWYCIPVNEYERPILAPEEKFFMKCDTKHVPVIVLLTKADCISQMAYNELKNKDYSAMEARNAMHAHGAEMMSALKGQVEGILTEFQFPPRGYVELAGMNKKEGDCTNLLKCTTDTLDTEALQLLLVSTQETNIQLCIEWAVQR
ncbi:hypothetical protein ID866_7394, partial [Astraeus odoratus]